MFPRSRDSVATRKWGNPEPCFLGSKEPRLLGKLETCFHGNVESSSRAEAEHGSMEAWIHVNTGEWFLDPLVPREGGNGLTGRAVHDLVELTRHDPEID